MQIYIVVHVYYIYSTEYICKFIYKKLVQGTCYAHKLFNADLYSNSILETPASFT